MASFSQKRTQTKLALFENETLAVQSLVGTIITFFLSHLQLMFYISVEKTQNYFLSATLEGF